jgi:hypothetical protein
MYSPGIFLPPFTPARTAGRVLFPFRRTSPTEHYYSKLGEAHDYSREPPKSFLYQAERFAEFSSAALPVSQRAGSSIAHTRNRTKIVVIMTAGGRKLGSIYRV